MPHLVSQFGELQAAHFDEKKDRFDGSTSILSSFLSRRRWGESYDVDSQHYAKASVLARLDEGGLAMRTSTIGKIVPSRTLAVPNFQILREAPPSQVSGHHRENLWRQQFPHQRLWLVRLNVHAQRSRASLRNINNITHVHLRTSASKCRFPFRRE